MAAAVLLLTAPALGQQGAAEPRSSLGADQAPAPGSSGDSRPVMVPPVSEPPGPAPGAAPPPAVVEPPRAVSGSAAPPGLPTPPGEGHQHVGLFFHVDLPVGYLRTRGSKGGTPFEGKGVAVGFALAVGWAPDDEWALAAELGVVKALSATGLGPNTSMEVQSLGLNVTRYIVPIDLFASVVVSASRLAISDDSSAYGEYDHSDIGFGLKILLGKEWRVSSFVGIGVAAEVFLSVNRDAGETLHTLGGGLVFSMTYR